MDEFIELDPRNAIVGSFNFCRLACRLAKENNRTVHTRLRGRDVYAKPDDNPHVIYNEWTRKE